MLEPDMATNLIDVLDEMYPQVATAFRQSIDLMQNDIRVTLVEQALANQAIEEVVSLLDFDQTYYEPLRRSVAAVYAAGGTFALDEIRRAGRTYGVSGAAIGHFDAANPRAEEWIRTRTSNLIVEITDEQRVAVRQAVLASWRRGEGPRTTALSLVGRINRATRRREGGVVGLTSRQSGWVNDAIDELMSGDPDTMRKYLRRRLRDKTFDPLVNRYISQGLPVPDNMVQRIAGRMKARTLKYRGDTIARTETLTSLNSSYYEGFEQQIEQGHIDRDKTLFVWDAANDLATRPHHAFMDGQERQSGDPFISGLGGLMKHPGDVTLGASGADRVNCRCRLITKVDFVQQFLDRYAQRAA